MRKGRGEEKGGGPDYFLGQGRHGGQGGIQFSHQPGNVILGEVAGPPGVQANRGGPDRQ